MNNTTKIVIAILLCAGAVLYFTSLTSEPNLNIDSCTYLVLAKSLALGQGFTNIDLVCCPPHAKFPLGFPLLLMPFVYFFGYNYIVLKGLIAMIACLILGSLSYLFQRHKIRHTGPVLLLTALSPWFFRYSHAVMSEIPYLLFSLLAIFFLFRYKEQKGWLTLQGIFLLVFLAIAYLTRSIGISLAVAAGFGLVLGNKHDGSRYKKAFFVMAGFALFAFSIGSFHPGNSIETNGSYLQQLFCDPYGTVSGGGNPFRSLVLRLVHNGYALAFYSFPDVLSGGEFKHRSVLSIFILSFAVAGFIAAFKKNRSVLEWYLLAYTFIVFVWPFTRHMGTRFIVPIIPFIFYYFMDGVSLLKDIIPVKKAGIIVYSALFLLLFSSNALFTFKAIHDEYRKDWSSRPSGRYCAMASWMRANSPPDADFITWNAPFLYVLADRKTTCIPWSDSIVDFENILQKNRGGYLISDPAEDPAVVQTALQRHPERFSQLYSNGSLEIFKIL
jgi:hypothetical protein